GGRALLPLRALGGAPAAASGPAGGGRWRLARHRQRGGLPGPRGAADHAHRAHRHRQHSHGGADMSVALTIALQSDKTAAEYATQAREVEARGFDGLSVYSDLGFQPPMAPLMVAADVTDRLRLGPSCLNPYLLHPVEI